MTRVAPRPNLFIVGAPKSGTTALYSYLKAHPDFFMCPGKEPNYFSQCGLTIKNPSYVSKEDEYLALFASAQNHSWIGEATPWNLYAPNAAEAIHGFNPNARIICMVRDPIEAAYALYFQLVRNGEEDSASFDRALALENERRQGLRLPRKDLYGSPLEGLFYREVFRYSRQIQRYLYLFAASQVKIIVFDDLAADSAAVVRNIFEWLGTDPEGWSGLTPIVNASQVTEQSGFWQFMNFGPLWIKHLWRASVPKRFRARVLRRVKQRYHKQLPRPPMSDWSRLELHAAYADEIESMRALLQRDLSDWGEKVKPTVANDVVDTRG